MTLTYPNIVPANNLRLPDALTIQHGDAPLLARFVLEGDKAAREMGVRLRLRHDFAELVHTNKQQVVGGSWFPLVNMFNPEHSDLSPENSYWISGEDDAGNIVATGAFRTHYWPDTTLADEARLLFCGRHGRAQPVQITAAAAVSITGIVVWGGSLWIHPDFRRRRLSRLVGRIGRALAVSRWPVDWMIALVTPALAENGAAFGYGYKHLSRGIFFPGSPLGDLELVVAYLSAAEAYEDFAEFLATELSGSESADAEALSESRLESTVTSVSLDERVHGSSNRS